ncbi:MAG: hypothetical protein M3Z09_07420 [Acidobacteriota bacterium]|nr:hypothetical protein [Acidobacteriota bacterium]
MSLTVALNVVWGLIALSAVLFFALAEQRHRCTRKSGGGLQRSCAVLLCVLLLFPCVSASDDILGLSSLSDVHGSSHTREKNAVQLTRALLELENLQISTVFVFALALCCLGLVEVSKFTNTARQLPCLVGRGPPALA